MWQAIRSERRVIEPNIGAKHFEAMLHYRRDEFLDKDLDSLYRGGVKLICYDDELYPQRLKQKEVGTPYLLFARGDLRLLDSPCVAMVGTRRCTRYGKLMAARIARGLAESGVTVVSGLADGIDTYAHSATIEAGGKTIAVLGSGVNRITPVTNQNFASGMITSGQGLIISEYLPSFTGAKYTFPERNRLISGLSLGVVIVEAGSGSGALITATNAAEQGREVFAVPANADIPQALGGIGLIKQGAHCVTNAEDILGILNLSKKENQKPSNLQLDVFEDKVYTALQDGKQNFDNLVAKLELSPAELSATLTALEMKKLIRKEPGNWYVSDS